MKTLAQMLFLALAFCAKAQNSLDYYLKVAKQNSPLISDNINQSKGNRLEIERLKVLYTKPQIGVVANCLLSPIISTDNNKTSFQPNAESATNYYGYDLAYSNGGQYQAMLNVAQPLFNGRRHITASEQFGVASQINENNAKIGEHDIEKAVIDQYVLCLQDKRQSAYAEAMVRLLEGQKEAMKKLVENNIYKQSDLTLISIEHQSSLAQLATFKANYRRDLMDLNILCGINDTALVELQSAQLSVSSPVPSSMFLEKYRLDSLYLMAQQKAFELKYKPQATFFANAGLNAVYAPTIPNRFGVSAGLSLSLNFYDGGQRAINRNKTQVLVQSVSSYKSNFIAQNTVRRNKLLNEILSYDERISISEQQLKDYEQVLNIYKKEILSGQISIMNYTVALKNLAAAQRDLSLLYSQQQWLINAYNYWNW